MIDHGIVYCSSPDPLFVAPDAVYVRSDITEVQTEMDDGQMVRSWKCHEVMYTPEEYVALQQKRNDALVAENIEMQIALAEAHEGIRA